MAPTPPRPPLVLASMYLFSGAAAFWLAAGLATLFAIPEYTRHYADLYQDPDAGIVAGVLLALLALAAAVGAGLAALLSLLAATGRPAARTLIYMLGGITTVGATALLLFDVSTAIPWHRWLMAGVAALTLILVVACGVLLALPASRAWFDVTRQADKARPASARLAQQQAPAPQHLSHPHELPHPYPPAAGRPQGPPPLPNAAVTPPGHVSATGHPAPESDCRPLPQPNPQPLNPQGPHTTLIDVDRTMITDPPQPTRIPSGIPGPVTPTTPNQPRSPFATTRRTILTIAGLTAAIAIAIGLTTAIGHLQDSDTNITGNDDPVQQLWTFPVDGRVDARPTVAEGTLYVSSGEYADRSERDDISVNGAMYAVDVATGEQRWTLPIEGSRFSPAVVSSGTVYAGTSTGVVSDGPVGAELFALDAATGEQRWTFPTDGEVTLAPAVADGTVYVGADGHLYAVDAATGEPRWEGTGDITAAPVVADGTLYLINGSGLYALDPATGQLRWEFAVNTEYDVAPVVAGGVVYVGGRDGNLRAIDAVTGEQRWTFPFGGRSTWSPVVAGGTVYVGGTDNNVYAVDAATGAQRWVLPTGELAPGSYMALADGTAWIVGYDYGRDSHLYAVDAATGEQRWAHPTEGWGGYLVIVDGMAYVGVNDGNLHALAL